MKLSEARQKFGKEEDFRNPLLSELMDQPIKILGFEQKEGEYGAYGLLTIQKADGTTGVFRTSSLVILQQLDVLSDVFKENGGTLEAVVKQEGRYYKLVDPE